MAFISMFPIAVYMAGSYSYDPWILSFSLLGFSYFFNMLIDHKIENESIIKMLLSFAVSFVVKPVYFPALFMLLFVPKEKFISTKQRRI